MRVFDIDRKAQGIPQPFAEPPAEVRAAIPELNKILAKRDELTGRQTKLLIEVEQLRAALHTDRHRDREARAIAAADGAPAPASLAEATEKLIAEKNSLAVALVDLIDQEQERAAAIITRNRDKWTRDLDQQITERAGRHIAAVVELEQARGAVTNSVTAKSWLASYPEPGPMPLVHHIPQPEVFEDKPPRPWSQTRDELYRDAENLPTLGGVRVDPATMLNESVDRHRGFAAQVRGRTTWFKGGTPGELDARDRIAQINAEIANKHPA